MPQLAPLNWVLLFIFFWFVLFLIVVSFWWLNYRVLQFDMRFFPVHQTNVWEW